ncbi:FmdB family zinc ribbon protein [Pyrinomonas methylaliphatogenes]|uniref:Putative regulatory protein, FmdB family n=1 Tax=Pyrinomonas methylaliphatogenes TaxID=454194 RepID=A0A0B6WUQ8_9BACT|nr:zinc ribbon domain-containing protein [Pyrinomonas methylaliphatogenes]MBX5479790.1 zinc ribbon domain-containing protein [Pyrinomonas methylaliphatogenes]CDM64447.1 putative regulatory protein, FmdB family [Pyrinomonas methylaliphatogenes]
MPIFEYVCQQCGHRFEKIMMAKANVECPNCRSERLEKQLSTFAVASRTTDSFKDELPAGPCTTCGDPRGPGACALD